MWTQYKGAMEIGVRRGQKCIHILKHLNSCPHSSCLPDCEPTWKVLPVEPDF